MKKYSIPSSYDKEINPVKDKTLGYLYFMDKDHPLSDKKGRVWHHRHVASVKIKRWVKKTEIVHHKDEDRSNNDGINLEIHPSNKEHQILHAIENGYTLKTIKKCEQCGKKFPSYHQLFCSNRCRGFKNRLFNISKAKLKKLVWEKPTTYIAKQFNVSDKAIDKRCKILRIEKPARGYWAKKNKGKKWKS